MKISLQDLRTMIRSILREQGDVPGRWRASDGNPVDSDDLDRLGHGGFRSEFSEDGLEEKNEATNQ